MESWIPRAAACIGIAILSPAGASAAGGGVSGSVADAATGEPIAGAMVTFRRGTPAHAITVYTDAGGRFAAPVVESGPGLSVRVRRIGFEDAVRPDGLVGASRLDLRLERETDPAELAAQLPANRWYQLVLDRIEDPGSREELKRQCTYCHQQGSAATRRV